MTLSLVASMIGVFNPNGYSEPSGPEKAPTPLTDSSILQTQPTPRDWSFQIGVAFISQNTVNEMFSGDFQRAEGDSGGQLYSFTLNWVAERFTIPWRGHLLTPQFEPYLTLTLVDENDRSPMPDYNGGVGFRWVDFPWNRWVDTTLFMGIGLSYSSRVFAVDRERHPRRDRAHLKFDWPIQFTFALPQVPHHQLVIFNDHQSGGHIFDRGGVNSLGVGYRVEF